MDESKIGPHHHEYTIDILGAGNRVACVKAWRFAYGIPEATHKKHISWASSARHISRKKEKEVLSSDSNIHIFHPREIFVIEWLKHFAASVGDKLPFGV